MRTLQSDAQSFVDAFQPYYDLDSLCSALNLPRDPTGSQADFRQSLSDFHEEGKTVYVIRQGCLMVEGEYVDGCEEAIQGLGLRISPDGPRGPSTGEIMLSDFCAFYSDGTHCAFDTAIAASGKKIVDFYPAVESDDTDELIAPLWDGGLGASSKDGFRDMVRCADIACIGVNNQLRKASGIDVTLFSWPGDQYGDLMSLGTMVLSHYHPSIGVSVDASGPDQPFPLGGASGSTTSPLNLALWVVESGIELGEHVEQTFDEIWTKMTKLQPLNLGLSMSRGKPATAHELTPSTAGLVSVPNAGNRWTTELFIRSQHLTADLENTKREGMAPIDLYRYSVETAVGSMPPVLCFAHERLEGPIRNDNQLHLS